MLFNFQLVVYGCLKCVKFLSAGFATFKLSSYSDMKSAKN